MRHWLEICQQWQRYLWFEISLSTKSGSQGWVLKSRILMIHVFITDGHEIYLVVLVIYAFIANLSESQGSTALKFTWESLWFEPSLCACPNHNGKQSIDSPRNLVIWALTVDLGNNWPSEGQTVLEFTFETLWFMKETIIVPQARKKLAF